MRDPAVPFDLGTTIDFRGQPINGRTRSQVVNLTGRRFGRLTAIAPWGRTPNGRSPKWTCECECGAFTEVASWCLSGGHTKSCGCLGRETSSRRYRETRLERFWSRVHKPDGDEACWTWTGKLTSDGYGRASFGGVRTLTHRYAYELLLGPIPAGLTIDHLCRNRACCNPAHLEPVTNAENIRRGLHGVLRTHCRHGHPLSGDNLVIYSGTRCCRICVRLKGRRAEAKLRLLRQKRAA